MPDPRLYVEGDLAPGAKVQLDADQARKLTQVLRLGPGAALRVFNERDGEWRAVMERADRRGAEIAVAARFRAPAAARDFDLLFAPVKRDATDLIVEKATELGVRRIRPIITARTIVETVRLERWAAIARAAAEQTERFDIPEILAPVALDRALAAWDDPERLLIHADESGEVWGGARAPDIAQALAGPAPARIAALVGPEGGFTADEQRLLRAQSFVRAVSLGPRILRAETAVIAILAVTQALWGDWRNPNSVA